MKIFILESLRKNDPKTGQMVHEFLDKKGIGNEFRIFRSKRELINILDAIKNKVASDKFQPFVHFDCHGNDKGIGVVMIDGKEELITWKEIRAAFREIYKASKLKSVLCMSSCEGFNVAKLVAHSEPCPYDHVCGSFEKISFDDSYHGYTQFYQLILEDKSIFDAAVEVHNTERGKNMKFLGINSKTLFKLAIDGYIEKECTPEKLEQRKNNNKENLQKLELGPMSMQQIDLLNSAYSLEGQKEILERYATTFFSLE